MPRWGISDPALKRVVVAMLFGPHLGRTILAYETAELLGEDGAWSGWPDLPIRLFTDAGIAAVSWSHSDDLWLADDRSVPFVIDGSTVRWLGGTIPAADRAVGGVLRSVALGRDGMTIGDDAFEISIRLLLELDSGWFEIFNAGDENGYAFHETRPAGDFVACA